MKPYKCECGENSPENFYPTFKGICKKCHAERVRNNRSANSEYYREYDRTRALQPKRVRARKTYSKTVAGREAHRRAHIAWIERNGLKRAAHILVGNAIRGGNLVKLPCEKCGSKKAQAHHDDYAKPLNVRWLCTKHHREVHRA
jgi:hypothetical protein